MLNSIPPLLRQCLDLYCFLQQGDFYCFAPLYSVEISHTNLMRFPLDKMNSVSLTQFSFLLYGQVKATITTLQEASYYVRSSKFCRQLIAGRTWLRDSHFRRPNQETVANMNALLRQALDGQILSKRCG